MSISLVIPNDNQREEGFLFQLVPQLGAYPILVQMLFEMFFGI